MAFVPKLKVESAKTSQLIPYVGNAKEHPEWQIEQIMSSIEQFGMNDPIAVWTNDIGHMEIVEGHGRLLACKRLDMDTVPIIRLDHLDDDARRAYVHVHNQLTMNTGFDLDILEQEMASLPDFEWDDLGFEKPEVLEDFEHVQQDEVPEMVPPRCEKGDIWKLGEHRLMCGDSTNPDDVERLMGGAEADLLLTDPPYGVKYETEAGKVYNDDLEGQELYAFLVDAFSAAAANARAGCSFYIWHPAGAICRTFLNAIHETEWELHQSLQWVKNHLVLGHSDYHYKNEPCMYGWKPGGEHYFAPTRKEVSIFDDEKPIEKMSRKELEDALREIRDGYETSILRYDRPMNSDLHPTMKPVELFAHLIRNSSQKDDIVLDIFAGSGTTVVACEEMDRTAYMMEYDPHYCDVIIERWERLTGKTAVKEE